MDTNPVFPFPFNPYPIQKRFMEELYKTIENKTSGIFESPTGTGKSLSICCGALKWLHDYQERTIRDLQNEITELKLSTSKITTADDWLQEEYEKIKKNKLLAELIFELDQIKKKQEKYNEMKTRVMKFKVKIPNVKNVDHFHNNDICKHKTELGSEKNILLEDDKSINDDVDLLLDESEEVEESVSDQDEKQIELEHGKSDIKIYISSRTHSQLSQFVGEIKRSPFSSNTRLVTIASRQHFCINNDVLKLKNVNLINERCLDMQKSKQKNTSVAEGGKVLKKNKTNNCTSCPYYNQSNITKLKERMLVEIMDMEDLVKNGKELKACPYYASKHALDDAEVILTSHAGIVSSGARSGFSLKLTDNILILDEAHGLSAALEQAHSAPVTERQLSAIKIYLQFYINKYKTKLSSKNLLSLNQMSFVVGKLLGMIQSKPSNVKSHNKTEIFTLEDFVIKAEVDHMNLRPLVEFCRNTKLAPKLHGFSVRYSQKDLIEETKNQIVIKKNPLEKFLNSMSKNKCYASPSIQENIEAVSSHKQNVSTEISAGSGLYAVLDFLEMLCDRSENGRVLAQRGCDTNAQLKYLLLNPAEHFAGVVKQCRSVVVTGGTMEPINEFQTLLSGNNVNNDNLTILRCDHVVPEENVLGICLSKGPSNMSLNFSYENRMSKDSLDEVSRILRNISSVVKGGVVCFVPSYSYENTLYEHLKNNKMLETISKKKKIFREPKSAMEVDKVLHDFALAVKNNELGINGALLLSVVGGKLSEGLNFSDDLGRCVMVIGMPYPNIKSVELQEKISYLNRTFGGNAGNMYYESLCMKAVNQCIGRAVRHANDYACVLLVDERYSRPQTTAALPSFVKRSLVSNCNFGSTMGNIVKFFSRHNNK